MRLSWRLAGTARARGPEVGFGSGYSRYLHCRPDVNPTSGRNAGCPALRGECVPEGCPSSRREFLTRPHWCRESTLRHSTVLSRPVKPGLTHRDGHRFLVAEPRSRLCPGHDVPRTIRGQPALRHQALLNQRPDRPALPRYGFLQRTVRSFRRIYRYLPSIRAKGDSRQTLKESWRHRSRAGGVRPDHRTRSGCVARVGRDQLPP